MLIITADDYGLNNKATDSILSASRSNLITSISAMVYMRDSIRAADLAGSCQIEIGLHLNFTSPYLELSTPKKLVEHQKNIAKFLLSNKLMPLLYNPFLRKSFEYVFRSQEDEFIRLYKKEPDFYNGHLHMHLCSNIIYDNLLPRKIPIRRTHTFMWGEKDPFNIIYRKLLDRYINKKYISTDAFYGLSPLNNLIKIKKIFLLSSVENIELMIHPKNDQELAFINSNIYLELLRAVKLGRFTDLRNN